MQRPPDNAARRWQGVLAFDENVLREIHADRTATVWGLLTVAGVMAVSGIGGFIWWAVLEDGPSKGEFFVESTVIGTLIATGLFFVWAGIVAATAGQLGRTDSEPLAATVRTLSYASAPFALSFFIFIPGLEYVISLLAVALLLASTTLATRVALGVTFGRALLSNLGGFFIWLLVLSSLMDAPDDYFAPAIFIWGWAA